MAFIKLPHGLTQQYGLKPFDLLVYSTIKKFMNNETREAFPSIQTLKKLTGSGSDKISVSINKMLGRCLFCYRRGHLRIYTFPECDQFEKIDLSLLKNEKLSSKEIAYLLSIQEYLFKDVEGVGKTSYQTSVLSTYLNIPEWEIWKIERGLKNKGILEIVKSKKINFETGLNCTERVFNLRKAGQMAQWVTYSNADSTQDFFLPQSSKDKDLQNLVKIIEDKNQKIRELEKKLDPRDITFSE